MKYYVNAAGAVWAFEDDGSQDSFIGEDMRPMTESEVEAHLNPKPTLAEVESARRSELLTLNQLAANQKSALSNRIGVINDNIEFGEATELELNELDLRTSQLVLWKKYAGALGRVTLQSGWFENIDWPIQPESGMDLSISPTGAV